MRSIVFLLLAFTGLMLYGGCAPSWKIAKTVERSGSGGYTIQPPQGWMIFKAGDRMLLSKHGVSLDNIFIGRKKCKEQFSHTAMSYDSSMLPHEMAEVTLSDLSSNPGITQAKMIELSNRRIDDIDATKVVVLYKTQENVTKKALVYLFMLGRWTYELSFCAVEQYYFDYGAKAFDTLADNFTLSKSLKAKAIDKK